jgi:hypothetical protein
MKSDSEDGKRMLRVELHENMRVAVNKEGFGSIDTHVDQLALS